MKYLKSFTERIYYSKKTKISKLKEDISDILLPLTDDGFKYLINYSIKDSAINWIKVIIYYGDVDIELNKSREG